MEKTGLSDYAIGWTCIDDSNKKHVINPKISEAEQTSTMSSLKLGPVLAKAFLELVGLNTCHITGFNNMF